MSFGSKNVGVKVQTTKKGFKLYEIKCFHFLKNYIKIVNYNRSLASL
jgi:hypothetical protein